MFELRAAEDIVGGDGTVWYPAGEVIDSLTTSTDGENAFSDLPLGKYHLFELSAPDGYVFSTEPQAVELLYAGDQTVIAEAAVTISNAYLPTEIILRKEKQIIQTNSHADGTITRSVSVVPVRVLRSACTVFRLTYGAERLMAGHPDCQRHNRTKTVC